jgi:fructose-bisphosphate aldolase class II
MLLDPRQTRLLIAHALEQRYAVLAVNADSPAAVYDVLEAARQDDAPVIIETSLWQLRGRSFGAGDALLGLARYCSTVAELAGDARFRAVPVVLHTDHIKGPETMPLLEAALGIYSSLSLDSSELSPAENIAAIGRLCGQAAAGNRPLTLEMEAGVDAGVSPVAECDALFGVAERNHPGYLALWAPGVGTQHGLGTDGYPTFSPEAVAAHQQRASVLAGRPIGIALHGSSGLPADRLQAAVRAGVAKVNWSSESLLLRSRAAQEFFSTHVAQLEQSHKDWKNTAMDNGLQAFVASRYVPRVAERISLLGGAGQGAAFLRTLGLA